MAHLILADGTVFEGELFGAKLDADGEVVFNTGMVGYPESLTDPSYRGQILVFTYPLIGNYGVPSEEKSEWLARRSDGSVCEGGGFSKNFESEDIHVRGVIIGQASEHMSHFSAVSTLARWLEHHKIPAITGVDTRALTKKLRETGVMLGRIVHEKDLGLSVGSGLTGTEDRGNEALSPKSFVLSPPIQDPNLLNLVAEVSCKEVQVYEANPLPDPITVIAYDCGMKRNILRSFLKRGVKVVRVPWDFDLESYREPYDGVFISNGPGDPKQCVPTIANVKKALEKNIPTFGICLGNQLMALAIGGDTYKLKYGHRSGNQPCLECREGKATKRCIITSQNHGFAVDSEKLPKGWSVWFQNANDGTVEGIRHASGRFYAVQFHPEATPGPEDANYLFDEFVGMLKEERVKKLVAA